MPDGIRSYRPRPGGAPIGDTPPLDSVRRSTFVSYEMAPRRFTSKLLRAEVVRNFNGSTRNDDCFSSSSSFGDSSDEMSEWDYPLDPPSTSSDLDAPEADHDHDVVAAPVPTQSPAPSNNEK